MAQKDNFYELENREDRKKNSKFEVGDLIEKQTVRLDTKKVVGARKMFIFDKHKARDKKGEFWVYDVFYPDNNDANYNYPLIDSPLFKYVKLA